MLHFLSSTSFKSYRALLLLFVSGLLACGGDEHECLPEPMVACTPNINTDFASLHRSIFGPRCGSDACHGANGRKGNLVLADADSSYQALLGMDGTHARVSPGDAACSMLLQRLESDDPGQRMPLGDSKLSEGLRCAVRTWIEAGAAR